MEKKRIYKYNNKKSPAIYLYKKLDDRAAGKTENLNSSLISREFYSFLFDSKQVKKIEDIDFLTKNKINYMFYYRLNQLKKWFQINHF